MQDPKLTYGEGGRLKSPPDPLLIDSAYKHDNSYAKYLMRHLHEVDLAYVLMLLKQDIIPQEEGTILLKQLSEVRDVPLEDFINPNLGDIYNSKESYLNKNVGKIAGWMHIGRPRREAINTAFNLCVREKLILFISELLNLGECMLEKARLEKDSIMPDFTYLYQATPTSFGHYLLTFFFPILRDLERLFLSLSDINECPLGCGISNGSNLNLDRKYLSDLLCFDKPIAHARDGMWRADTPIQIMSCLSICFSNLSRLAEELEIFNSVEFSMIELPDSLCRTSVIMPQKKNPYPLTYIRGMSNFLLGKLVASNSYGKVFSGNPDSRIFAYVDIPESLDRSTEAIRLFSKVIKTIELNHKNIKNNLGKGYSYASDLSEYITTKFKVDYKTAHEIVGSLIRKLVSQEITDLNSTHLVNEIKEKSDLEIKISEKEFQNIIDPNEIIKKRITLGSAAPQIVDKMIDEQIVIMNEYSEKLRRLKSKIDQSRMNDIVEKKLNSKK